MTARGCTFSGKNFVHASREISKCWNWRIFFTSNANQYNDKKTKEEYVAFVFQDFNLTYKYTKAS